MAEYINTLNVKKIERYLLNEESIKMFENMTNHE